VKNYPKNHFLNQKVHELGLVLYKISGTSIKFKIQN